MIVGQQVCHSGRMEMLQLDLFQFQSNLEFVNSVDLGELHVVVEQRLGDDVQDAQPLYSHRLILTLGTFRVNVTMLL